MIYNVVVHLNGEQPVLADLFEMPGARDVMLRCTNLRQQNGKRPVFADDVQSIFYLPFAHIRFLEILPASLSESDDDRPLPLPAGVRHGRNGAGPAEAEADIEIDEDFLRRIREV